MRSRLLAPVVVLLAAPAPALAQVEAPQPTSAELGASEYGVSRALRPTTFGVAPGAIVVGAPVSVSLRLAGPDRRVRVRIVMTRAGGRRPAAVLRLGRRRTRRAITRRWTPRLPAGRYAAQLVVGGRRWQRVALTVTAAPAPAPAASPGVFPVQGAWNFGGPGARFGARRIGHVHQGQDVFAAEETPLVSPVAGTVLRRRVQPSGAGHYLVIRAGDGHAYVFMHLVAGSETVGRGDAVKAGQQIGRVGHTGAADGSHLHFEIWPGGWYAAGSKPIDPLPALQAWAAGG